MSIGLYDVPGGQEWYGFDQAVSDAYDPISSLSSSASSNYTLSKDHGEREFPNLILYLYDQGCWIDGTQNCTAACADAASVWAGTNWTYTLANCMIYPIVAVALGNGVLNYTTRVFNSTVMNDTYSDVALSIAAKYGIVGDADLDTVAAWSTINRCTEAYCKAVDPSSSNCTLTETMGYRARWNIQGWQPVLRFNTSLCADVSAPINQDLGGVGMVIAYILQLSILLAGWVVETFNNTAAAFVTYIALILSRPSRTRLLLRKHWTKAKKLQHRLKSSSQAVALKVALVEFQKTQVFFVLAVAVAALLAVNNAAYLLVSSWQQLWNNISFIATLALSGCYPVVLNLLILRKTAKEALPVYLMSISTACVTVSTALWIYTVAYQPSPSQISFSSGYLLPECGTSGYTSPTQTCYDGDTVDGFKAYTSTLLFPIVVLVFLIIEEVEIFKDVAGADGKKAEGKKQKRVNVFEYVRKTIEEVDLRPVQAHVEQVSRDTYAWVRRKTPPAARYWFHDLILVGKVWCRELRWKAEDGITGFSSCLSPTSIMSARFSQTVLVPAGSWIELVSLRAWTATRDYGFRRLILWLLDALYKLVPFIAELGLVAINALLLAQYTGYLGIPSDNSWSLGQIISCTIWAPVLAEYAYLLICGIEEGSEYRLSKPYHVTRRDDNDRDSEDAASDAESEVDRKSSDDSLEMGSITPRRSTNASSNRKDSGADAADAQSMADSYATESEQTLLTARRSYESPYLGT